MALMTSIPGLRALSPDIYYRESDLEQIDNKASASASASQEPSLIVLCTWLGGATDRRIIKYIDGYRQRFPSSAILLTRARLANITVHSFATLRASLAPAREVIRRHAGSNSSSTSASLSESSSTGTILLHIFSHGGSNTAIQLFRSLQEEDDAAADLKQHRQKQHQSNNNRNNNIRSAIFAIIFDCCPGTTSLTRSYNAAALSIPPTLPTILQYAIKSLLYPTIACITLSQAIGFSPSVENLREDLNDLNLFGDGACRLYLYSKEDEMVDWRAVERHANGARERGLRVEDVLFENGMHCALPRDHAEKYWRCIEELWEKSQSQSKSGVEQQQQQQQQQQEVEGEKETETTTTTNQVLRSRL